MDEGPDPPAVERRPTPRERPLAIVVHTNAGTYLSTCRWFAEPAGAVSAHYLVGLDGRVAQFVDEGDTAHHAGRVREPRAPVVRERGGDPNRYTIGVEFEDGGDPLAVERPAAQYEAGAELIAAIAARWGIPLDREHVIGHREVFAAKDCPGNLDVERLVGEAAAASA